MIGGLLGRKGRRGGWFKFFVVIAWFGGELVGAVVAGIATAVMHAGQEPPMPPIYLAALVCAGLGVGVVFLIAGLLPDLRPPGNTSREARRHVASTRGRLATIRHA